MSESSTLPKRSKQGVPITAGTTAVAKVVLPTVNLPVLSPGFPLARNTAAIEDSTSRYYLPGQSPHGKRSRSATGAAVETPSSSSTPLNVLDALCTEEVDAHAGSGTDSAMAPAHHAAATRTKAYLTKLFQEPARCEQDVYRLVDVAYCRRFLRDEEEAVRKETAGASANNSTAAAAKNVSAFNSCLTAGQHRRYYAMALEWLRHLPSRTAPPDSGEVLKVIQREQRFFLELLRREAVSRRAVPPLYEWLSPVLLRYAKVWRAARMRRQLVRFLEDAKAHRDTLLLCCAPPATSEQGNDTTAAAEPDYAGVTFENDDEDGSGDATSAPSHTLTLQQRYQRRYPSLRVLQWHMVKLYNSQLTGVAAPFPNPQVQSTVQWTATDGAGIAAAPSSPVPGIPYNLPSRLPLSALPQVHADGDFSSHSDAEAEGSGNTDDAKEADADGEDGSASFAALHAPFDATSSIAVSSLRSYVEQHLLPRFGWRPSKKNSGGGGDGGDGGDGAEATAANREDVIESVSLSLTFAAVLKLFVAHVDLEEPRTSFRVPVRVQLTPLAAHTTSTTIRANEEANAAAATATPHYHAHVLVGDAVPNVKESRHSVQVAAAEHLLRQQGVDGTHHSSAASAASSPPSGYATAPFGAHVHLTRSATMQGSVVQGEAAVQAAGGDRIKASAAVLLSMKEAVADAAPTLLFHVSAPVEAATGALPVDGRADSASRVDVVLAKMERLNATAGGTPLPTSTPMAVELTDHETAARSLYLLETLSPREMLQLDLIFAFYPDAVVHLHRVQLTASDTPADNNAGDAERDAERDGDMRVLAVEQLTGATWGRLRQRLQGRPAESLLTSPSPAEVLGTQSWDLLYDTLAWLLDTIERCASDALRSLQSSEEEGVSARDGVAERDRFIFFILSNHANLINTSAKAKAYVKESRHADGMAENVTATFTESRFAVRYVLQDTSELYPDYEPRIDITFETGNLNFLEDDGTHESGGDAGGDGTGASPVALRLFRDPHTWNADTIPFTFHRTAPSAASPPPTPHT